MEEAVSLAIVPVDLAEACEFIRQHHRHHIPPVGHRASIAVSDGDQIRGVAVLGRPVARRLDDGWTLEVTRVATDGTRNACSKLYGASWKLAQALGYRRLITYTLQSESGSSLRAVGWRCIEATTRAGQGWSVKSRPRVDKHPLQSKLRWEVSL
ncbi:MAG: XF1762 family protein [Solirubrobacterales bacterium]